MENPRWLFGLLMFFVLCQIMFNFLEDPAASSADWLGSDTQESFGNLTAGQIGEQAYPTGGVAQFTEIPVNFMSTAWKAIPNQVEDRVMQIAWKGNLISDRRKSLGVLISIA